MADEDTELWIERDFDEASKSIVALIEKVMVAISLIRLSQAIQQLCRLSRENLIYTHTYIHIF